MRRKKPPPNWQLFERLVAGLHATDPRATVTWDEVIDGRQFDVIVRFRFQDYAFLTAIECKDYRVEATDVEAFVTKARDVHADKAIIVSSKGFRSGAKTVAKRHGIHLQTLRELDGLPPWVITRSYAPVIVITDMTAHTAEGQLAYRFPQWNNELTYVIKHAALVTTERVILETFLDAHRHEWEPTLRKDQPRQITVAVAPGTMLHVPFEDPLPSGSIRFLAELTTGQEVDAHGIDVNLLPRTYEYRDELLGTQREVTGADVPLGFDTTIVAGVFYEDPRTETRYFVERIDDGWATIHMIESYQHGDLVQLSYRQKVQPPIYVVPVNDPKTLARLRKLLAHLRRGPLSTIRVAGPADPCPCASGRTLAACHGQLTGKRPVILTRRPA